MITETTPISTEVLQIFAENLKIHCDLYTIIHYGFDAEMDLEKLLEDLFNKNILRIEY